MVRAFAVPGQVQAPLVIAADMAATVTLDGNEIATIPTDGQADVMVPLGQHLVQAVSLENPNDVFRQIIDVEDTGSLAIIVELKPIAEQRVMNEMAGVWTEQIRRSGTWTGTTDRYTVVRNTRLTLAPDGETITGNLFMTRNFTDARGEELQELSATMKLLIGDGDVSDAILSFAQERVTGTWADLPTALISDLTVDEASVIRFTLTLKEGDVEELELAKLLSR